MVDCYYHIVTATWVAIFYGIKTFFVLGEYRFFFTNFFILQNATTGEKYTFGIFRALSHMIGISYGAEGPPTGRLIAVELFGTFIIVFQIF